MGLKGCRAQGYGAAVVQGSDGSRAGGLQI